MTKGSIDNQIIVCSYKTYDNCNSDGDKNHYQIEWSRFGNVKLENGQPKDGLQINMIRSKIADYQF